jgi:alcohol dehydrogenase
MTSEFEVKTHVLSGQGEALRLEHHMQKNNLKKPFLIIDRGVFNSSYGKEFMESFNPSSYLVYSEREPTYQLLEEYRSEPIKYHSQSIVGVGGGSVIDFAKGLAFLAKNDRPAIDYRGFPKNHMKPLPIVAIPTTAGTGSEVTYNAVFVDEKTKKKMGINTKECFPALSILDPNFIQSCPREATISAGLDALTHAIESYGATKSTILTRAISESAIKILIRNLSYIDSIGTHITYAEKLQYGAYLAGLALMNSGSGPSGALSYILGPKFNIPHGIAGAIFLPYVTELNEAYGVTYPEVFKGKSNRLTYDIFDLYDKIKFKYKSLKPYGVNEENVHILLEGAETLQTAFNQNPVPFNVENAKNIIRRLLK